MVNIYHDKLSVAVILLLQQVDPRPIFKEYRLLVDTDMRLDGVMQLDPVGCAGAMSLVHFREAVFCMGTRHSPKYPKRGRCV